MRNKVLWSDEPKIELFDLDAYGEAWWWQHHAVGMFFRLVRIKTEYREIFDENLLQSALDLRLGRRFTYQQDNDPKHKTKMSRSHFFAKSLNVLEWPSQRPDLNPI